MKNASIIPVAEIVSALSFALDLAEDSVPGHALRCCLLGMRIAAAIGLSGTDSASLYYALLLKDIGCSSNAALLSEIIAGGERSLKRSARFQDWTHTTLSGTLSLWPHIGPGSSTPSRLARLLSVGIHHKGNRQEIVSTRCLRGAAILRKIGFSGATADAVRHLDEHWDGNGLPSGWKGGRIPLLSRILLVAQHLDVFHSEFGAAVAVSTMEERSGRWFDPDLAAAAASLHRQGRLWSHIPGADTRLAVLGLEPGQRLLASPPQVDAICEAFAEVVDVKSSFTYNHSRQVTRTALQIAGTLGLPENRRGIVYRTALLHDLGKLRVANSILDKPGVLTKSEWAIVCEHPLHTRSILERVHAFAELAEIASHHHEKLDGSGYPFGLLAPQISMEARLLTVADVFTALIEDRPYRRGLPIGKVRDIMSREVPRKLDPVCFDALLASLDSAPGAVEARRTRPPRILPRPEFA